MKIFILALICSLLAGCARYQPNIPKVLGVYNSDVNADIAGGTWLSAYDAMPEMTPTDLAAKQERRNHLLGEFIWSVDRNYDRFEVAYYENVAKADIVADFLGLGLGASSTMLNGSSHAKTILAITASTVIGGKASIDAHWYDSRSRDAIVAEMRALRAQQLMLIDSAMASPINAYTLDQGISDVQAYFQAGTLVSALQEIAQSAGAQQAAAKAVLKSIHPPCSKSSPCAQ